MRTFGDRITGCLWGVSSDETCGAPQSPAFRLKRNLRSAETSNRSRKQEWGEKRGGVDVTRRDRDWKTTDPRQGSRTESAPALQGSQSIPTASCTPSRAGVHRLKTTKKQSIYSLTCICKYVERRRMCNHTDERYTHTHTYGETRRDEKDTKKKVRLRTVSFLWTVG